MRLLFKLALVIFVTTFFVSAKAESLHVYTGSGFFINTEGYIATANHVIKDGSKFVVIYKGNKYYARLVAGDNWNDVAILKIDAQTSFIPLAYQGLTEGPGVLMGFPYPQQLGQNIKHEKGTIYPGLTVTTDIDSCPGFSGGPIINSNNAAVGVLSQGLAKTVYKPYECTSGSLGYSTYYVAVMAAKLGIKTYRPTANVYSASQILSMNYNNVVLIIAW